MIGQKPKSIILNKKNGDIETSNVQNVLLELGEIDGETSFEGGEKACEQRKRIVIRKADNH